MTLRLVSVVGVLGQVMLIIQGLIVPPIIISNLGADAYGKYILSYISMGIIYAISPLGTGALVKRLLPVENSKDRKSALFYSQLWFQILTLLATLSLFLSIVGVLSSPETQARIFGFDFDINGICTVLIYQLAFLVYAQYLDYFRCTNRIYVYAVAGTLYIAISIVFVLVLAKYLKVAWVGAYLAGSAVSALAVTVPLFLLVYREIGAQLCFPSVVNLKRDWSLGLPVLGISILDIVISSSDRYFIAGYLDSRDVGFYGPAYSLGIVSVFFARGINNSLAPLLSVAADTFDDARFNEVLDSAVRAFLVVSVPASVGIFVVGADLLNVYVGSEISNAASGVFYLTSVAAIFLGLQIIVNNVFFVRERTLDTFVITAVGALITIAAGVSVTPRYPSINTLAAITVASYSLCFFLIWRRAKTLCKLSLNWNWLFRLGLAALAMGFSLGLIRRYWFSFGGNPQFSAVTFQIVLGMALYGMFMLLFSVVRVQGRRFSFA